MAKVKGIHTLEEAEAVWDTPAGDRSAEERVLRAVRGCCENGRRESRDGYNVRHWYDCSCTMDARSRFDQWCARNRKLHPSRLFDQRLARERKKLARERWVGRRVRYGGDEYQIDKVRIRQGDVEYRFQPCASGNVLWVPRYRWWDGYGDGMTLSGTVQALE